MVDLLGSFYVVLPFAKKRFKSVNPKLNRKIIRATRKKATKYCQNVVVSINSSDIPSTNASVK